MSALQTVLVNEFTNAVLDPEFGIYVLLASIGEEGEDDNCLLNSVELGGRPLHFKYTSKHKLNSSNISVEITPLPRNRARVNYTINSVPNCRLVHEIAIAILYRGTFCLKCILPPVVILWSIYGVYLCMCGSFDCAWL